MFEEPLLYFGILLVIHLLSFFRWGSWLFPLSSVFALFGIIYSDTFLVSDSTHIFSFTTTNFREFFGYIVAGLGLLVGVYASSYMRDSQAKNRFFGLMGLFQWACLLVVFSNHLLLFVIAWELTSLISYFLIGFKSKSEKAQRGAFQALLITSFGGVLLLGAAILLSQSSGSYLISEILENSGSLIGTSSYRISLILVALAILTKSAQVPFHFWLPGAMQAPTPVSAYLHSAALVKLGLFAAGLFWPLFRYDLVWHVGLSTIGLLSFAWGAFQSIFQRDLKSGLAHSTFSQLGLILVFFAQNRETSFQLACLLVLAHSLYKFVLFLSVGIFSYTENSQDIRKLSAWFSKSKSLGLIALVSAASMAGLPPLLGFVTKELVLKSFLLPFPQKSAQIFSLTCFFCGALFTLLYAFIFFLKIFISKQAQPEKKHDIPSAIPSAMILALVIPSFLSLTLGLFGQSLSEYFRSFLNAESGLSIHGIPQEWDLGLGLSLGVIFLGSLLSLGLLRSKVFWRWDAEKFLSSFRADKIFQKIVFKRLPSIAHTLSTQTEKIFWNYGLGLMSLLASALILYLAPLDHFKFPSWETINPIHAQMSLAIFTSGILALFIAFLPPNFVRIFILGLIGYLVTYTFAAFGAPDLVLTQLIIETCSLVLLVLAWINAKTRSTYESASAWAWGLSFAFAFLVVATFQELATPQPMKLSSLYFFENSLILGQGKNIVNVILVDFRGLDTLGEISVLAIAYFGALSVFNRRKVNSNLVIYPLTTSWMKFVGKAIGFGLTAFGIFFLLRGHNFPGGGFIGGLLFSLALFIRMLFYAKTPHSILMTLTGLMLAYLSALIPGFFGEFFEARPLLGIYSPILFDTGVFFTVAGSLSGFLEILLILRSEKWRFKVKEEIK